MGSTTDSLARTFVNQQLAEARAQVQTLAEKVARGDYQALRALSDADRNYRAFMRASDLLAAEESPAAPPALTDMERRLLSAAGMTEARYLEMKGGSK